MKSWKRNLYCWHRSFLESAEAERRRKKVLDRKTICFIFQKMGRGGRGGRGRRRSHRRHYSPCRGCTYPPSYYYTYPSYPLYYPYTYTSPYYYPTNETVIVKDTTPSTTTYYGSCICKKGKVVKDACHDGVAMCVTKKGNEGICFHLPTQTSGCEFSKGAICNK